MSFQTNIPGSIDVNKNGVINFVTLNCLSEHWGHHYSKTTPVAPNLYGVTKNDSLQVADSKIKKKVASLGDGIMNPLVGDGSLTQFNKHLEAQLEQNQITRQQYDDDRYRLESRIPHAIFLQEATKEVAATLSDYLNKDWIFPLIPQGLKYEMYQAYHRKEMPALGKQPVDDTENGVALLVLTAPGDKVDVRTSYIPTDGTKGSAALIAQVKYNPDRLGGKTARFASFHINGNPDESIGNKQLNNVLNVVENHHQLPPADITAIGSDLNQDPTLYSQSQASRLAPSRVQMIQNAQYEIFVKGVSTENLINRQNEKEIDFIGFRSPGIQWKNVQDFVGPIINSTDHRPVFSTKQIILPKPKQVSANNNNSTASSKQMLVAAAVAVVAIACLVGYWVSRR